MTGFGSHPNVSPLIEFMTHAEVVGILLTNGHKVHIVKGTYQEHPAVNDKGQDIEIFIGTEQNTGERIVGQTKDVVAVLLLG